MTTTLGRATIGDPHGGTIRQQGNRLSFTADIEGTSVDDCQAKMQQLAGMLDNPDEEVFPFTCGEDTTFDGFYRVRNLTLSPVAVYLATGLCPFTVELERVPTFATPVFESVVGSVVRTNSHGVTAPNGVITSWYSGASYTVEIDPTATLGPLAIEDGNISIYTAGAPLAVGSILSYLKPADYYKNQCKIEVKYGSTWYPVVGHQIPLGVGINWRLNNGVTRLYPSADVGHGPFKVGTYQSAAWTDKEFGVMTNSTTFTGATADSSDRALSVTVLRNSPERVTVRTKNGAVSYDWTLRRGELHVELSITQPSTGTARTWGVGCTTATGSTSFTGGVRRTGTNTRYLISCPSTVTADTANGYLNLSSSALNAQFQITADYYWGGALTLSDTQIRDMYLAARMERQRIVPR